MKQIIIIILFSVGLTGYSQPKLFNQAIVSTKTTIVAPDEDEPAQTSSVGANGEEIRVMRFGGDGETQTTTWIKNDLMKTYSENETSRTTVIRDNTKKITTTIMEMMGRKMGFYATDEEQEQMRKQMDSMMRSRNDAQRPNPEAPIYEIVYLDESKKIAGYACKKALIIAKRSTRSDTTQVWYVPDIKLQGIASTGGSLGGFGGMSPQIGSGGMDLLTGFPMQYERTLNRGRKMTVQVTKLVTDKDIEEKEFLVPKDVEVKPMKEMQNGGRPGTMQIRVGG